MIGDEKYYGGLRNLDRQLARFLQKEGWEGERILMTKKGMVKISYSGWAEVYDWKKM